MVITVTISERPGQCRWCGCTYEHPCPDGCGWVNRTQTLCTACEELDRLVRTVRGRHALARRFQEASS